MVSLKKKKKQKQTKLARQNIFGKLKSVKLIVSRNHADLHMTIVMTFAAPQTNGSTLLKKDKLFLRTQQIMPFQGNIVKQNMVDDQNLKKKMAK